MYCSLKRIKHSRVYLNFKDSAEVFKFRAQFGGHAFVNKKGAQYKCTVEYAPYQKIPREKAKEDPREGTYEKGDLTPFCKPSDHFTMHSARGTTCLYKYCVV